MKSPASTAEPAWLRWLLITLALGFLALNLALPLAAVFIEGFRKGVDAYVGAEAAGNSITGYACSQCEGYIDARNSQTNTANITATTTVTTQGSTRAVIAGANAVGNTATFYVSRPGH